jgi:hypothetical protein
VQHFGEHPVQKADLEGRLRGGLAGGQGPG